MMPGVMDRPIGRTHRQSARAYLDEIRSLLPDRFVPPDHPDHRKIRSILDLLNRVGDLAETLKSMPDQASAERIQGCTETFSISTNGIGVAVDVVQGDFLKICEVAGREGGESL